MARFTYKGDPRGESSPSVITMFGLEFPANVPVEVVDAHAVAKLRGNSHFTEDGVEPKRGPGRPKKQQDEPVGDA